VRGVDWIVGSEYLRVAGHFTTQTKLNMHNGRGRLWLDGQLIGSERTDCWI